MPLVQRVCVCVGGGGGGVVCQECNFSHESAALLHCGSYSDIAKFYCK